MNMKFRNSVKREKVYKPFFNRGEFGMLIAPSPTDGFALTLAMSACDCKAYQLPNILMPQFEYGAYIDTVSEKSQLQAEKETAANRSKVGIPENFEIIVGTTNQKNINYSKNRYFTPRCHSDLDDASTISDLSKHESCIFVILDTVLHRPKEFNAEQRDLFINIVNKINANGSSLVLVSRHADTQESDFGVPMDFVINLTHDLDYYDLNKYKIKIQR